jgi:hypothetical protein
LLHEIAKIMITHLLLVEIGPFKRGRLVYGLFAAVGMHWEVRVTTTGRERVADCFGGERAIFSMSLASVISGSCVVIVGAFLVGSRRVLTVGGSLLAFGWFGVGIGHGHWSSIVR